MKTTCEPTPSVSTRWRVETRPADGALVVVAPSGQPVSYATTDADKEALLGLLARVDARHRMRAELAGEA